MAEREKESQQKSRRDDTSSEARALPKELPDPDLIAAKAAEAAKQKELARQKKARKEELEENKSRSRMDTKELEADSQVKWKAINGLEELATAGGRAPADLAAPVEEELPPETSSDRVPFPLNKSFISQPVLSERFRKEIWKAVIIDGKSVRQVSAAYNVEMSRVGAVVRLMEVQKEWERIGKPMAIPYNEAVMGMLPKTLFLEDQRLAYGKKSHESINDLPVHRATGSQIFYPTSESRAFTRADAAKAFSDTLLPADDRVPHPELAIIHKEVLQDLSPEVRRTRAAEREKAAQEAAEKAALAKAKEDARVKRVDVGKVEFRFTEIMVDHAGKDGRGRKGTGWRYGAPLMDRSKGHVRIPTAVE